MASAAYLTQGIKASGFLSTVGYEHTCVWLYLFTCCTCMHASACTHPCVSWASYSLFSFGKWTHQNVISKVLECVVSLVQTCQAPGLTRRWLWTFVFSPGAPHGHCSFFPLTIFLLFFASTHLYLITLLHPILKSLVILVILMMITNKAMCCAVITCWLQGLEKQLI